jgi:hypothetical protein
MTHARRAMTALLLGVALIPARAHAGGDNQIRDPANPAHVIDLVWDDRRLPVRWVLSSDGLPGSGVDGATLAAELGAAFDAWQSLPTSRIAFEYGGTIDARNAGGTGRLGAGIDGRNLVTFTDPDMLFPAGVVAVTVLTGFTDDTVITAAESDLDGDGVADLPPGTYPAGRIFDGDIVFNANAPWQVSGAPGTTDVRAVALHEAGHLLGLCHSAIRDAIMWPFLRSDVAAARTLQPDDIAWASSLYPDEPAYSSVFGQIRGHVANGLSGLPVLGAHVYSVDPGSGKAVVGTYSADDGRFVIPGVGAGSWLVGIEPLDGDPIGLEPFRVNAVVRSTTDTRFPEEFWDADEGAAEVDAGAAQPVAVTPGSTASGIDIVTNTLELPAVSRALSRGFNLLAWPVAVPSGASAFDLLHALGDASDVVAVERFAVDTSTFERAEYVDGAPAGRDFPLRRGEAYVVHMEHDKVVGFAGRPDCPTLDLALGLNLIGVPCAPSGYSARQMLVDLGAPGEVVSLQRWDPDTAAFQVMQYGPTGLPQGPDFAVRDGEGYVVTMAVARQDVHLPGAGRTFAPVIRGLSPGRGVPGTVVLVLGDNFDPDVTADVVTFDGVAAAVVAATRTGISVVVPQAATSGPVRVTVSGRPSNTLDFVVDPALVDEAESGSTALVSGQTAAGTIGADGEQDRYTFTALAGSIVTATAQALTPGSPDLFLVLENPYGAVIAHDDDGGGGTDPRLSDFELPLTGTYALVVTNIPGSGNGAYRLTLTVQTRSSAPAVSILGGNFQSSLGGAVLPDPLTVLVTGPTGAAVAGVPVTFVATETSISAATASVVSAGTVVLSTNASGIVSIEAALPPTTTAKTFTITVTAADATPVAFDVAATATAVASITVNGDQQTGIAGQPLPVPLEVVLQDSGGAGVPGALVAFFPAAGDGLVTPFGKQLTDATGAARTVFQLGSDASQAQLVAVFVPGQSVPVLFEAFARGDAPATIVSNRSAFSRVTSGATYLNGLQVQVVDQFGNPVEGATIDYTGPPGMAIAPGLRADGTAYAGFQTDANGRHAAMITATLGLIPTIDEFGARGAQYLASTYRVTATVSGTTLRQDFNIDVDMGPSIAIRADSPVVQVAPMGEPLAQRFKYVAGRVQREDPALRPDDPGFDFGDWRNNDFTRLRSFTIEGVAVRIDVRRQDGNRETDYALRPVQPAPISGVTDHFGTVEVQAVAGDVAGVSYLTATADVIDVEFTRQDGFSLGHHFFVREDAYATAAHVRVTGPTIAVTLDDLGTGLDLRTAHASLNGFDFFDGAMPPGTLPAFPDRLQLFAGGRLVTTYGPGLVGDSAFGHAVLEYKPSLPRLASGLNTVTVFPVLDHAGNGQGMPVVQEFTFP